MDAGHGDERIENGAVEPSLPGFVEKAADLKAMREQLEDMSLPPDAVETAVTMTLTARFLHTEGRALLDASHIARASGSAEPHQ